MSQTKPKLGQTDVLPLVMDDLLARGLAGVETYGTPLQTFNGRNALVDAYEEALDLAMYLKQAILEQQTPDPKADLCPVCSLTPNVDCAH